MKPISFALAAAAAVICTQAHSEIFKCTTPEGKVIYSSTACPDGVGDVALQRRGPPLLARDGEPADHVFIINNNATRILQIPLGARTTLVESDLYKSNQAMRPPPPKVPSNCLEARYEAECFDPSGGQSTAKEASRIKITYGNFEGGKVIVHP